MRKLSITSQIVVLFFSIILLSITIFTFVSTTITRMATEEEIYSRLIFYSGVINNYDSTNHPPLKTDDLQVEYIIINKDNVIESKNFDKFINQDDLNEIIEEFNFQPDFVYKNNIENHNDEKIYFTVNYTGNGNYIIMITDSTYINLRTKVVSSRLMITFAVISSISILIIGLWGNRLVSRIKKIQQHIDSMPKNQYKVEYDDEGFDEVGELSKSIELMRKEIYQSESSKKEMLQNVSHDFKTPIAVIKSYAEAQIDGMADEESSQIIINNADILKHKVNMLLEYNSLEYLSKNREFEEVNMAELIRTIVQGYKFQTNLNIELDLDENVCFTGYRENNR